MRISDWSSDVCSSDLRLVFDSFNGCATYVSPFSINNPDGWRYWLIHFANSYRARQVYNNLLHANSSEQAHYGRAGLHMLSYDPRHEDGSLYLFDPSGRESRSEEHTSELQSLMRISYAVFCLTKKKIINN